MTPSAGRQTPNVAWALLPLLAAALVTLTTHLGLALSDDSYYYVKPARDALAGGGLQLSTYFAPLIPLVLTALGWLGAEPLAAFRYLNITLFAISAALSAAVARKAGAGPWFALLTGALFVLSTTLLNDYSWAMSEGLAFTLTLAAFLFLFTYFASGRPIGWIGAAICAGLACLTRYAALPIVAALAFGLLAFDAGRPFARRLWTAALAVLIASLPLGLYLLRNSLISGFPTRYSGYVASPLTADQVAWYLYNTLSWFIPGRFLRGREILAGALVAVALLAGGLAFWRLERAAPAARSSSRPAILTLVASIMLTSLMLIIARGFADLGAFNPRYLSPILLGLLILIPCGLDRLWTAGRLPYRLFVAGFALIFLVYYGYRTVDYVDQMYTNGLGYSNAGWHASETVAYLRSDPGLELVATGEMGIYFWTGERPQPVNAFGGEIGLVQHLCSSGAELLLMDQMPLEAYGMDEPAVIHGLALERQFNDSRLYRCLTP